MLTKQVWKRAYGNIYLTLSVQIRSHFWSVFSCIQSEYRKIRTRNNFVFGQFSHSVVLKEFNAYLVWASSFCESCKGWFHLLLLLCNKQSIKVKKFSQHKNKLKIIPRYLFTRLHVFLMLSQKILGWPWWF